MIPVLVQFEICPPIFLKDHVISHSCMFQVIIRGLDDFQRKTLRFLIGSSVLDQLLNFGITFEDEYSVLL